MERCRLPERFLSELSALRDHRALASAEILKEFLSFPGLKLYSRAIVGNANVCWVMDFVDHIYLENDFLSTLDFLLRWLNAIQASLNDWLESGRGTLLYSFAQSFYYGCSEDLRKVPEEPSVPSYAVLVSAVVLLSLVYHYLTGNVDRGGSKAYSRTSLDFRDVYVAIVLFLGAYVWIKFRGVAPKGVHPRKLVDKQGATREMYDARLTPPKWNGQKVRKLELGRFPTPQEAHNKFLIAAFYYDRDAGLLDGWFQVPPMRVKERSLTGKEKRAWVIRQAKKVYEDFKKGAEAGAALVQELIGACEGPATQDQDEVNVDPCGASLLNSAEPHQLVCVSQAESSGMGMAMLDNHGLDCASDSFDEMHEGLALPNGHNLGFGEGSSLPVSQPPPNTESGTSLNGSDQLDLLHTRVRTQQQQISLQQQQISDQQQQIYLLQQQRSDQQQQICLQQREIQDFGALMLQFQNKQGIQQQQLRGFWIQNPQWSYQTYPQEQQLQGVNQGVPSFEMEMEQSMHQQNYSGFTAPPPDGPEALQAFWELDTLSDICLSQ